MRRWVLYGAAGTAALIGTVLAVGYALPVGHTVSRSIALEASPDAVFNVIADFASYPEWRSSVVRVEIEGEPGVGQRVIEISRDGTIPFRVEVRDAPSRLVMRIDDPGLPFGGTWTYDLQARPGGGTTLTITEDGEVYNPIFRVVSRFGFGHEATIDGYLGDLESRGVR